MIHESVKKIKHAVVIKAGKEFILRRLIHTQKTKNKKKTTNWAFIFKNKLSQRCLSKQGNNAYAYNKEQINLHVINAKLVPEVEYRSWQRSFSSLIMLKPLSCLEKRPSGK